MTHARNLLVCLACSLALVLVIGGGGCANGGDDSGATGDDDSSVPGDDVSAGDGTAPVDAACGAPKTLCGTSCTSTTNDPKNCGKCGTVCGKDQLCNGGVCGYSCTAPETLCNAPPEGGTAEAGGGEGGKAEGGTTEGGAGEAGSGDSGAKPDAAASDASAGDGGSSAPYCANLGTDDSNCGSCGKVCLGQHKCNSGVCGLSCGNGQKACIAGDVCINTGTCCSSADCTVTGEICPQPGGACQCPGGETVCSKTNSCIASSDCCTDADCAAVAGATCPTPGQACQCATGEKACIATKTCIPQTSCCTAAGECCADPLGKSCGAATPQAALTLGAAPVTVSGMLTATGEEDWVAVSFNSESNLAFHAHVVFTANPNSAFLFDLASDCKGSFKACGEGGVCQGKTDWEVAYQTGSPAPDPNGSTWAPIPAIGTVYIRVYRATGAALTCDQWTLAISE